eukprot:TRINITY_DN12774_c0_g1_i1.p1 TRINITY_DN12774_c0_g1~~TRINITY_DN12774_c0_g1_i1.p1  ORF type:complete len:345 (-),score=79.25 TRINITY_DN12774_c0_g1_i1:216-1250(-)
MAARIEVKTSEGSKDKNPCCTLSPVGTAMTFTESAWMVKNDYIDKCTALLRDVLYVHATEMKLAGLFTELMDKYFEAKSDGHCANTAAVEQRCPSGFYPGMELDERRLEEDKAGSWLGRRLKGGKAKSAAAGAAAALNFDMESSDPNQERMGIEEVAGMFVVHAFFLFLGCLYNIVHVVHRRFRRWQGKGEEGDQDALDKMYDWAVNLVNALDSKWNKLGGEAGAPRKSARASQAEKHDVSEDVQETKYEVEIIHSEMDELRMQMNHMQATSDKILAKLEALSTDRSATALQATDEKKPMKKTKSGKSTVMGRKSVAAEPGEAAKEPPRAGGVADPAEGPAETE